MSIWQCCVFDLPLCRSEIFYHLNMGTEFIEIGLTDTAVTVFLIKGTACSWAESRILRPPFLRISRSRVCII